MELLIIFCFILKYSTVLSLKSNLEKNDLIFLSKFIIPSLEGKTKGEAGKIGVIGGSIEYTGAPYFSAITALKVGADLVYVITTENAAPVIKAYSPELIVYPFLNIETLTKVISLLKKMDTIIIGPGLGREPDTLKLIYEIIQACKDLSKPLILDADGLYAISKNVSIIKDYPTPGVILTPNHHEAKKIMQASTNDSYWYDFWGDSVTVLVKGQEDYYHCHDSCFTWSVAEGGSGRRAGGQGDILSGTLGTFYNWALKSRKLNNTNLCKDKPLTTVQLAKSIATYAASIFTRKCNKLAFALHGRSMTASDMLNEIHPAFKELFETS